MAGGAWFCSVSIGIVSIYTADGHVRSRHMVDTAVRHRLVGMTIETRGRRTGSDHVDDRLRRAVVTGGTGTGAIGGDVMLGALDQTPVRYIVTVVARLPVRLIAAHGNRVTMRMVVKVVGRMTLAAIASRCDRSIRRRVMAGGTAVMLLVVRAIDEVRIIDRGGMAAAAFDLQRDLGGVILCRMRREVAHDTRMALAAIAGRCDRSVGRRIMAGGAAVMLQVVGRIHKGRVIDRRTVTA